MTSKYMGIRLPLSLYEKIDGENKSEKIREILEMYYSGQFLSEKDFEKIKMENEILKAKYEMLNNHFEEVKQLLYNQITELKQHNEFLEREIEDLKTIIIEKVARRRWWQFWKPKLKVSNGQPLDILTK